MEAILNSICSLIDRVIERPIYTVLEILPNLMYNVSGGIIKTAIENLIFPFKELTDTLGMGDMMDFSELENLDLTSLLGDMMSGDDMPFDLSKLDIKQLSSFGTAVTVQSKRTLSGQPVNITYIQADKPAIIVTALRFLVEMMKAPGNEDFLTGFMGGSGDENDMFATFSGGITDELAAMSTDETVEWLYKLFFRERAVVEEKPAEDYMPTIIYVDNEEETSEGAGLYIFMLLLALGEVIILKKRHKIESYMEFKRLKKEVSAAKINQEV